MARLQIFASHEPLTQRLPGPTKEGLSKEDLPWMGAGTVNERTASVREMYFRFPLAIRRPLPAGDSETFRLMRI